MNGANPIATVLAIPRVSRHLDRRLPRYTSYPTAAQFDSSVDRRTYERWLGSLPVEEKISLYPHVPCERASRRRQIPVRPNPRERHQSPPKTGFRLPTNAS